MSELPERLGLDLTYALTSDPEVPSYLFQRPASTVFESETKLKHPCLAVAEGKEHIVHLLFEKLVRRRLGGCEGAAVLDEIAQVAVLFFADGGLQRDGLLGDLEDLSHLLRRYLHARADLLAGRLPAILLDQPSADAEQLIDGLDHMHGYSNGPGLVRDGPRDGLTNPPGRIGAELVAFSVVELFDRSNEAYVALLNQVQERHAPADVFLRHADHQAKVSLR